MPGTTAGFAIGNRMAVPGQRFTRPRTRLVVAPDGSVAVREGRAREEEEAPAGRLRAALRPG
jgi:hypothetical protein